MTKDDVINLFGEEHQDAAKALGIGKSAFSQWPHNLTRRQVVHVVGSAVMMGKTIPETLLFKCKTVRR